MTGAEALGAVRTLLAELTGRDPGDLAPATGLLGRGLALDSRRAATLLAVIHERHGVDVAALDLGLDCLDSLGALAAFVAAHTH